MYDDTVTPADRLERIVGAVQALASLTREPQDRLDRALSLFRRAFRGEPPPGPIHDAFRRIYEAVGDPPYGTPFGASLSALGPPERERLVQTLVELLVLVVRDTPAAPAPGA